MPPAPADLILVAVLKTRRDLEIARVLGWYRIPLKSAPKTVAVDWLAFYQTAQFGPEQWSVRYLAPVRGHELTTRGELLRDQADHPRAGDLYYKLQLGPLEVLSRPIPARRWRRLTFVYTTGERLLAAAELNDLIIQSEERELLWQALRERGLTAERQYTPGRGGELDLALLCALGNLGLRLDPSRSLKERAGWRFLAVSSEAVKADLAGVVARIERAVQELGGPAPEP